MKEGSTGTYSIYLSSAPTASVKITMSSQNSLSFSPAYVTFTTANYATSQSVTVTSTISSVNNEGANEYQIIHTVTTTDTNYINANTVPSTIYAYVIKASSPSVLISEDVVFQESNGGSYSIVLSSEPTSDVTITLSSSGSTISFSPTVLTFTKNNYYTPQEIYLSSVESTTPNSLKYSITILHTVTSSDSSYNGIAPLPSGSIKVTAVNPCRAGMYAWPPGSGTCQPCPLGYQCPTLYGASIACSAGYFSPLGV